MGASSLVKQLRGFKLRQFQNPLRWLCWESLVSAVPFGEADAKLLGRQAKYKELVQIGMSPIESEG